MKKYKKDDELTQEVIKELLDYNSETGILRWKERDAKWFEGRKYDSERLKSHFNSAFAGKEAFTADDGRGYLTGIILNKAYKAHRIIWLWYYGEWPKDQIDHINGNRKDNTIKNLQESSFIFNNKNAKIRKDNLSGITGVRWNSRDSFWEAHIGSKRIYKGHSKENAIKIRKEAEVEYGYHKNHGRKK